MNAFRIPTIRARRRLVRAASALVLALLAAAVSAASAAAAVVPVGNDVAGARSLADAIAADPGAVTGASWALPAPSGAPHGVGDTPLTLFPTDGPTFAILTSGSAANVDQPGFYSSVSLAGGWSGRGATDRDTSVLRIDFEAPAGSNCLTFDFQFLTEEYPQYVGSSYNDAFIAELDATTWTTPSGPLNPIVAPDNFAFDAAGDVVSVNSTGLGGMSPASGAGTAFDGGGNGYGAATVLLSASTAVTPGPTRSSCRSSTRATRSSTPPSSSTTSAPRGSRARARTASRAPGRPTRSRSPPSRRARRATSARRTP